MCWFPFCAKLYIKGHFCIAVIKITWRLSFQKAYRPARGQFTNIVVTIQFNSEFITKNTKKIFKSGGGNQ